MTTQTHEAVRRTLALLEPVRAVGLGKRRVGRQNDGGYVMLDDLDGVDVCYSLGVGPDVSWDLDMAERGALIRQYDHTVNSVPGTHPNFIWSRVGITHDDSVSPELKRIDTLIQQNGDAHRRDMLLKIDIEGHEWDSLRVLSTDTLGRFRQIVCEFHGLSLLDQPSFQQRTEQLFQLMRRTHCVVHVHGNNYAPMTTVAGVPVADVLEVTWARRADYDFEPSTDLFPTPLDTPCNAALPDLFLGNFRFVA